MKYRCALSGWRMLICPKPSSTPSRARMRLAITSSCRVGRKSGMSMRSSGVFLQRRQHAFGEAAHLAELVAGADHQLEQPHALIDVAAEALGDKFAGAGH